MEQKYTNCNMTGESPQFRQIMDPLIEALVKPDYLKRDLFFALLLIAMKENDFLLLKNVDSGSINIIDYMVTKKSKNVIHEGSFVLNGFQDMPLKIIACPINDTILIIATIPELYKHAYSLCVKLNKFIHISPLGIPSHFTNLNELFIDFKDKIVNPVKGTILNYHKFPSANLFGLPDDIVHQILLSLAVRDVLNISECCKRLHRIVKEDSLWFRIYGRDFPNKHKSEERCWREAYVEEYLLKQEEKFTLRSDAETEFQDFAMPNYTRHVPESRWEVIL
ncbi:uncharacterized protein LOC114353932 [Ostrinia furnacalis]|uniref:uncharacterized protein LOC114353932 n=1 Tax=Ostrinia furnacalis TaxID=93504 RepID=UPI00103EFEF9|nr:uncharacterized protein LOC114353932 [Ostrinia furnacalis]